MPHHNNFLKQGKCSYCNKSGIIHREYSGENFCQHCFINNIEKNVNSTISRYKMLSPNDKIIVGLSGGKDSITLLYNLNKIQNKKYQSESIIALIIDEGIKNYRENSIKKAIEFCIKYDIEYKVISFKERIGYTLDEIIKKKSNTADYKYACNYCATFRRRLLNDGAKELNGTLLALGHNLTDFAETYLINILYKRLRLIGNQYLFKKENTNIRHYFLKRISPLMRIPEEEILLYANIKKFNYYPLHCPYREKDPIIRKRVLDFIQECKKYSPEIEFNLLNGFLELSAMLYKQTEVNFSQRCQSCGYPCGNNQICIFCSYLKEID
ncbi:MAG: ATP-binding protein [Promethearchaeota archaeon]